MDATMHVVIKVGVVIHDCHGGRGRGLTVYMDKFSPGKLSSS